MHGSPRVRLVVRLGLGLFIALLLATLARPALADYSIDQVDIDATVATDGSLSVQETREFDFDGSYHGVYWRIPTGTYEGRRVETSITSVGEVVNGTYQEFTESTSGLDGTYQVSSGSSYVQVKLYSAHDDDTARFVINYTDTNLASRWADTAELYWKFVSDGWDVESENVICTIHLPVPDGATVSAGGNVRAWGHGPLDASVSFSGNDVVYSVPGVGSDEYAEARIVFPAEWLSGATASSEARLDTILSEEQQWADEANAQRTRARVLSYGISAICLVVAVASIVVAILKRHQYKLSHRPQFDDDYFRDVPSDDHPAVLAALLDGGKASDDGLSASLLRLADEGLVGLDVVSTSRRGVLGNKEEKDYRILSRKPLRRTACASKAIQCAEDVDAALLGFLFGTVGRRSHRAEDATQAEDSVLMSDFRSVAKGSPSAYQEGYDNWKDTVEGSCLSRGFFTDDRPTGRGLVRGLGVLDAVLAMVAAWLFVVGVLAGAIALALILLLCAGTVTCFLLARGMRELSSEAVELTAKLEALRRWLKEFTHLKEAVPRDVVLWNRLLVMATALGVSKEVIDQLKVAAPEILDDPVMRPIYVWYGYYGLGANRTPAAAFGEAVHTAHTVSTAALAQSSSSSGGGLGGGFSGGGGGGFGGGGGGGAF